LTDTNIAPERTHRSRTIGSSLTWLPITQPPPWK